MLNMAHPEERKEFGTRGEQCLRQEVPTPSCPPKIQMVPLNEGPSGKRLAQRLDRQWPSSRERRPDVLQSD